MARAELMRRRAAKQQPTPAQTTDVPLEKETGIGGTLKRAAYEFVTPIAAMPESYIKETTPKASDIVQAVRERPTETAAAIAGPALTVGGAAFGGVLGLAGGLTAASTVQRGAQSVDRKLFDLTGGVAGNANPKPSEVDSGIQILTDQVLGAVIPIGFRSLKTAATAQRLGKLEQAAVALESKATTPAQQAALAGVKSQIAKLKVPGSEAAKQLGDDQVFSYNGIRFDDAAKRIKGDSWDSRTFAGSLTAGKASDFGADAAVLNPISGKLSQANGKRLLEIVKRDNDDYTKALLPETNVFKGLDQAKRTLDSALVQKQKDLRISQAMQQRSVFAPQKANTPILGSELLKVFDDPDVVAAMAGGGYEPKLLAIRAAVGKSGAMQTTDLAKMMSTIQSQFVSRDDDRARAVFYETVFPKLKSLFESAANRPTGAATKGYASSVIKYFDNRFGLADVGGDFAKTILENKPLQAIDTLSSRETFNQAQRAFEKFAGKGQFGDYMRLLVSSASKDAQGQPQAHLLNQVISKINPDAPEVVSALGKEYIENLKALQTVLNAEAIDGTKAQLTALAAGRSTQKAKELADEFKSLAVNTLAYNPLGAGAAQANIGRALAGQAFQPNLSRATVSQQATERFAQGISDPARAVITSAGIQAAQPAVTGYTSADERRKAAEKKLQELEATSQGVSSTLGGQGGGPEEAAPSMRQQDDLGYFIDGLMGQDALGKTISAATAQADLDQLIRMQMEEDTKVLKKVSTRQEEGFRTRVYKDTVGKRTVGIGFNMDAPGARKIWQEAGVKTGFDDVLAGRNTISKDEAEALYTQTKTTARSGASKLVKNFAELGKHQQDALADMVFQLGQAGAMAFARTRGLIEQGKFKEAAQAMLESRNAKQTPSRVLRRAYMLEHNVPLEEANSYLISMGKINSKNSIA
jgi:lysozyme